MALSGAERQKAYLHRQRDELLSLRQRVHDLEGVLAATQARIAESDGLRLARASPQQVAHQLADALSDPDLARLWVLIGEHLKAGPSRGRRVPVEPPEH